MGRWHAHYARKAGGELVAIVDPSSDAASALAHRTRGAAVFADAGTMLQAVRPHVVHVCTPLATHLPISLLAVAAGSHALVEKPITPTASEATTLLDAARARSVHVCPVHQFAFQRGVARLAQALGELGEPLGITFTICSAGAERAAHGSLDAVVAEMLPHPLSILQVLWPRNPVRTEDWSAHAARPGELVAQGKSGAVPVGVRISMSARPTRCDMEVLCSGGSVNVNLFHGYAVVRRGKPSRLDKASQPFRLAGATLGAAAANLAGRALRRELAYPGLATLVARFYAAARGTGDNPIRPEDTLAVAAVRDHLVREALPGAAR